MTFSDNFTQDLFFYADRQCDEIGETCTIIECQMYGPGSRVTVDEAVEIDSMWDDPVAFFDSAEPVQF